MEISPGCTCGSRLTETKSPSPSTAQPRKSKPGPRLAMVAGANAFTEAYRGSGSMLMLLCWYLAETERLHLTGSLGLERAVNCGTVIGLMGDW